MKTLIIMRGLPGSGKSTTAKSMGGEVFSTDDFFMRDGEYVFNIKQLGLFHKLNQDRVHNQMIAGIPVIVVDNTNTQAWEMKPYVEMADLHGYEVEFKEPTSPWWGLFSKTMTDDQKQAFCTELASRNTHGVTVDVIRKMLDRWEFDMTVEKCRLLKI